jgi:hypothetical protein
MQEAAGVQRSDSRQLRRNEVTLGGLRPGKDSLARAKALYKNGRFGNDPFPDPSIWEVFSGGWKLRIAANAPKIIQSITASQALMVLESKSESRAKLRIQRVVFDPAGAPGRGWKTGWGLALGDSCSRAPKVYGQPASRGPSTKDGQELELLFYQFDWAGPDVPQVMEVLCTPEKNGKPGRVVEIMLATASL